MTVSVPFVDLRRQYETIKEEIDAAVLDVIRNSAFILAEPTRTFEEQFAAFCGTKHCIGVANGTDALQLALTAMAIGPGDEVIVPANTFIATALAVSHVGATVVPVDVDASTKLIDGAHIASAITRKTAAVIPVHLFGKPVAMEPIRKLCDAKGIAILEDAAQAHGARCGNARVGTFGNAAAFSFYPGKNLGCYGDGGAIVTDSDDIAVSVRRLRDLGQTRKYIHAVKGYNSRLDGIQAAVLSVKLQRLDTWNARRRQLAKRYDALLQTKNVATNSSSPAGESVQHLYCVEVEGREDVVRMLEEAGIGHGIHYPTPIHRHEAYADLGYPEGAFPVSEAWCQRTLSLPMFAELEEEEMDRVVDVLTRALDAS